MLSSFSFIFFYFILFLPSFYLGGSGGGDDDYYYYYYYYVVLSFQPRSQAKNEEKFIFSYSLRLGCISYVVPILSRLTSKNITSI